MTLAFGFAATVTKGHRFANFTHAERVALGVSLMFFIAAAFCGLVANIPGRLGGFPLERLQDGATMDEAAALRLVAQVVDSVRTVNASKANWLVTAFLLQLIAILMLAITVVAIVL